VSWIHSHEAIRATNLPSYQPFFPERPDDPRPRNSMRNRRIAESRQGGPWGS
jgi:hypothetical protein